LFPIENGGELAALYSFAFLLIAVRGSGTWSVDGSR
jgi:putative oxidoreductase